MITAMTHTTLVVEDYDAAISWYTEKLGLELRGDDAFGEGYRFVTVGVKGQDVGIILHKVMGEQSTEAPGQPVGSAHGLVFDSTDCRAEVEGLRQRGVNVVQGPDEVQWGIQAVFEDLYGNTHVLVEPAPHAG